MHEPGNAPALHPTMKVAIPAEANRPVYKPARCDANGNIYFKAYQPDDHRVPVVRVDATGAILKYTLDSDPDFAQATAYDFSILPNGNLYQPVQVGKDVYVVAFSKDGKIKQKTKLEAQFWVSRLTVFNDKSFLAIGTEPQPPSEQKRQAPKLFMAMFDDRGRLVRRVTLGNLPPGGDKEANGDPHDGVPILAALNSDAQADAKGNVYLMVRSDPAVVYVFDASARIARSFKVNAPEPRMDAVSMSVDQDRLAFVFRHAFRGMSHGQDLITVVDASDGAEIGRYSAAAELGTILACFKPDDFAFIGSEKDHLAIQHAAAK
jgi:hypothetical protein